jgi:uncharacterized protein GlcG (DUF336 family)
MLDIRSAGQIVDVALKHGQQRQWKPLTVAVLDAGGSLMALMRDNGATFLRPQIAQAKAWGALGLGMGGRALAERAASHPAFMSAMAALCDGRIIPVPGGVLVRDQSHSILGAVGVSGESPDRDEECAVAGIQAAGLIADTGNSA